MIKVETNQGCVAHTIDSFKKAYPKTSLSFDLEQSKNLFSSFKLVFSKEMLKRVEDFVRDFYLVKDFADYQNEVLSPSLKDKANLRPKPSVLCCFDFHYNSRTEEIKLIEVNTNASGYLIGLSSYLGHNLPIESYQERLIDSFKNSGLLSSKTLYIMDENPKQQKMYLEFLMYEELFESLGHKVEIIDSKLLDQKLQTEIIDGAIYNRDTDFFFDKLPGLNNVFLSQSMEVSPHPLDYDLLAKKTNLDVLQNLKPTDSQAQKLLEQLQEFLLESGLVKEGFESFEDLIKKKKSLFFKPATAFGGKSTYKGSSVSNKYLKEIWERNLLYQQNFPVDQFEVSGSKWKYDLRFYTYDGQVQFYLARVYQGQITNFQTLGGGFAPIVFE